jgi:lipoyl(octanoyl) transferase
MLQPVIKQLGLTEYEPVWQAMKQFTDRRTKCSRDEFWITEHYPVYTQGLNGKKQHVLNTGHIPLVQVDRGGQVTYHGPGQMVIYCLLDLQRLGLGIRQLVSILEQSIINVLFDYGITAQARQDAPGVYIGAAKIAALGLRIRKGSCYHGLSFNLDMDLSPFAGINPCGLEDLKVTQLSEHVAEFSSQEVGQNLCSQLFNLIGYE